MRNIDRSEDISKMNTSKEALSLIIFNKLRSLEHVLCESFCSPVGTTTRHCVVDDLLPEEIAQSIYKEFRHDDDFWIARSSFRERKSTYAKIDTLHPIIASITDAFCEKRILEVVSNVTRIESLQPDPTLYAGGISQMKVGDFLNPHIDNSHDKTRTRYRRLNLLYYVTPSWTEENGGNLELWDTQVTRPARICSKFNRLVIMETNENSYHSVDTVLASGNRCCVSNYFFTEESPRKTEYFHVTSFTGRPNQKMIRLYGALDNTIRTLIAKIFGITRGKKEVRSD